MTLSQIRQLLSERGIQLTKSLGQNFLHDRNLLQKIVAAAELKKEDRVLEIGPGLGPLTELVLRSAGDLLAIEKDARLIQFLRERFEPTPGQRSGVLPAENPGRLRLVHADALSYLRDQPRDWSGWKMVSNLPYSVASPILVELAQASSGPERMVATLQLEVARRLIAAADDPDYGLLSLLVQIDYEPLGFFKIPASCFFPEPDVDSACVTLIRRPQALLSPSGRGMFVDLVKRAFSQRRKMMLKLLKSRWKVSALERAFESAGVSPQARAESVNLGQFVRLTKVLESDFQDG